jgi:hypothetical protein
MACHFLFDDRDVFLLQRVPAGASLRFCPPLRSLLFPDRCAVSSDEICAYPADFYAERFWALIEAKHETLGFGRLRITMHQPQDTKETHDHGKSKPQAKHFVSRAFFHRHLLATSGLDQDDLFGECLPIEQYDTRRIVGGY